MNRTARGISVCVALTALAGCAVERESFENSHAYLRRANYFQAYQVLADAIAEHPDDARLRREYESVRIAFLLDRGQGYVFANREELALEDFDAVLAAQPGHKTALEWAAKAKGKLADRAVEAGDVERAEADLELALQQYRRALEYVPDHPAASKGVEIVAKTWSERREDAEVKYRRAVDVLGEELLGEAWWNLSNALRQDPEHVGAQRRSPEVERRLLEGRLDRATELEDAGHYAAAWREYSDLRKALPAVRKALPHADFSEFDSLADRVAAMQREKEVLAMIAEGEMAAYRGEFADARKKLEAAHDQSERERARINQLLVLLRERELGKRYVAAKFLELERAYEEALAAYRAIDESWGKTAAEGFRDVRDRLSGLESALKLALEAYDKGQKAEAAGDLEAAIDAYEDALLVAPGYRDLDAKVRELKARLQADGQASETPAER